MSVVRDKPMIIFPGDINLIGIQLKAEEEIFLSPHLIIFTKIIKPQQLVGFG